MSRKLRDDQIESTLTIVHDRNLDSVQALEMGLAWQEVEAALPVGWITSLTKTEPGWTPAYEVSAGHFHGSPNDDVLADGPTPAEALRALAAALRERAA